MVINTKKNSPPTEDVLRMRSQGVSDDRIINELNSSNKFNPKEIYDAMNQADIKANVKGGGFPHNDTLIDEELNQRKNQDLLKQIDDFNSSDYQGEEQPQNELYQEAPEKEESPAMAAPIREGFPTQQEPYQQQQYQQPSDYAPYSQDTQLQEVIETIVEEKWEELLDKISEINLWRERVNMDILSIKQEIVRTQERFDILQTAVLGKVSEYNKNVTNISTDMKALEAVLQKIIQPLSENVRDLNRITEEFKKHKK